jgi:hypothetical protein
MGNVGSRNKQYLGHSQYICIIFKSPWNYLDMGYPAEAPVLKDWLRAVHQPPTPNPLKRLGGQDFRSTEALPRLGTATKFGVHNVLTQSRK